MKKTLVKFLGGLAFLIALLFVPVAYFSFKDYRGYFEGKHGQLQETSIQPAGDDSLFTRHWVTLRNDEGLKVDCGMLVPRRKGKTYPAIILLGGKATGKYAIDYAIDIKDVIVIAPDYPYEPQESYTIPEFLRDVPEIREALLNMVPSVMLVTDYLWQRPDVDTTKIVLLGYSFGAPLVPAIVSVDRRAAVAAMVYGGGNLQSLIVHNVKRYESAMAAEFIGMLSGLLLRPLEPLRYVDEISPIPLIMINGKHDEQIPPANARLLHEKAREPKDIIWLESKHVHVNNVELTQRIVGVLSLQLARLGILHEKTQ